MSGVGGKVEMGWQRVLGGILNPDAFYGQPYQNNNKYK